MAVARREAAIAIVMVSVGLKIDVDKQQHGQKGAATCLGVTLKIASNDLQA